MNYIELLNKFYELLQCSRVSNNAQLLYYTLLAINNKCSWSDWFLRTNVSLFSLMSISEKAFVNARAELKQLGLIDFVPSKRRGECTKYKILYPTKEGTKDSTKDVQKTYRRRTEDVQSADIDKHKLKPKKKDTNVSKEKFGEYGHVRLSGDEVNKLDQEFGPDLAKAAIVFLDEYCERKAYKHQSSYLTIKKWVIAAVKEEKVKAGQPRQSQVPRKTGFQNFEERSDVDYDALALERLKEKLGGEKQ